MQSLFLPQLCQNRTCLNKEGYSLSQWISPCQVTFEYLIKVPYTRGGHSLCRLASSTIARQNTIYTYLQNVLVDRLATHHQLRSLFFY